MEETSYDLHGMVTICPACDEVIMPDDGCACAMCGHPFHFDCLDLDTLCCLECAVNAEIIDHTPRRDEGDTDE